MSFSFLTLIYVSFVLWMLTSAAAVIILICWAAYGIVRVLREFGTKGR